VASGCISGWLWRVSSVIPPSVRSHGPRRTNLSRIRRANSVAVSGLPDSASAKMGCGPGSRATPASPGSRAIWALVLGPVAPEVCPCLAGGCVAVAPHCRQPLSPPARAC
jgi:hypothetical protein